MTHGFEQSAFTLCSLKYRRNIKAPIDRRRILEPTARQERMARLRLLSHVERRFDAVSAAEKTHFRSLYTVVVAFMLASLHPLS